jgi:hypothetical protein
MMTGIAPKFQGITRYKGEQYRIENHVRANYENKDRVQVSAFFADHGAVLTDNDFFQFFKDAYNIVFPDALKGISSEKVLESALYDASNPEASAVLKQIERIVPEIIDKTFDKKIIAYVESREKAGADIDGQSIEHLDLNS